MSEHRVAESNLKKEDHAYPATLLAGKPDDAQIALKQVKIFTLTHMVSHEKLADRTVLVYGPHNNLRHVPAESSTDVSELIRLALAYRNMHRSTSLEILFAFPHDLNDNRECPCMLLSMSSRTAADNYELVIHSVTGTRIQRLSTLLHNRMGICCGYLGQPANSHGNSYAVLVNSIYPRKYFTGKI
ncbi:hypothetical protein EG68_00158 [Paragonimus skrjabini miyazakii]|uniref:Uncharacterized protein n=1 Tax=Paragonimus skrjabini miyazakii TaxID=59628 RepID=A0A8S9ZCJ7_9TREM|nr:hypothetical protein EG68_00158 [Paragonimus skrjabini miyazakii]